MAPSAYQFVWQTEQGLFATRSGAKHAIRQSPSYPHTGQSLADEDGQESMLQLVLFKFGMTKYVADSKLLELVTVALLTEWGCFYTFGISGL